MKIQGEGVKPSALQRNLPRPTSTPEQLGQLATACDRATFGRGNQDVYDESYRKALKMDTTGFAAQFDPTLSGLIKIIEGRTHHPDFDRGCNRL